MATQVLNMDAGIVCTHGGSAKAIVPNHHVKLSGKFAPMFNVPLVIEGCPGFPKSASGSSGQSNVVVLPNCVQLVFHLGTKRVTSMGAPLLLQDSLSVAIPLGLPATVINAGQHRVKAL